MLNKATYAGDAELRSYSPMFAVEGGSWTVSSVNFGA